MWKKTTYILKRNSIKTPCWFLLFELSSFFEKRNKLKPHEKICETKDFCGIVMQSEKNNMLKFNQYMKSDKMPYIIYTDIESKNEKYRWMNKQSKKIFRNKNRWPFSFWIFKVNNLGIYSYRNQAYFISRGKLFEKVLRIFKRTSEKYNWLWREKKWFRQQKKNWNYIKTQKGCYICGKIILKKFVKTKNYQKVRDLVIFQLHIVHVI